MSAKHECLVLISPFDLSKFIKNCQIYLALEYNAEQNTWQTFIKSSKLRQQE